MAVLSRIFGSPRKERGRLLPLYNAMAALGRDPAWYLEGEVPDTLNGRFDLLTALLSLILLRLEQAGAAAKSDTVLLTELFIQDMDATVRQLGIGDLVVGKHLGRMMSALGGRLGAFREATDLEPVVRRNIFHDAPPSERAVAEVATRLARLRDALADTPLDSILEGKLPRP